MGTTRDKHESQQAMYDALQINREMLGKGETESKHFINEKTLIYIAVLGMTPTKYREEHGLEKRQNLLDIVNDFELSLIDLAQIKNKELLLEGKTYKERKPKVIEYVDGLKQGPEGGKPGAETRGRPV